MDVRAFLLFQVWAQQLPTGPECKDLDTTQENWCQVRDATIHITFFTHHVFTNFISVPVNIIRQ